jgi:tRNA threonylcarbamoyladenosine biosynthesis protein TsaB
VAWNSMKILSIDTSTSTCTVGVVDARGILAQSVDDSGQTHARHLMGMIDGTLTQAGISVQAIEGFAVITGPGTFTGLRIGISTTQGLAYALSKPIAGVTSLDALAAQSDLSVTHICSMMDARRSEVYYGLYESVAGHQRQIGQHGVSRPVEMLKHVKEPCHFIGTGARLYQDLIKSSLGSLAQFSQTSKDAIQAETIANLAMAQFQACDNQQLPAVSPYYIRRSDAEIHSHRIKP